METTEWLFRAFQLVVTIVVGVIAWSAKRELTKLDKVVEVCQLVRVDMAILETKLANHDRADDDRFRNIDQRFREHWEMITASRRGTGEG